MSETNEKSTHFLGTYFDRENVLLASRAAGILAWTALIIYGLTFLVSFTQFMIQFSTGLFFQKGTSILDVISFFTPYFVQLVPGFAYFTGLKFMQHTLLILLDVEDNTRRTARAK